MSAVPRLAEPPEVVPAEGANLVRYTAAFHDKCLVFYRFHGRICVIGIEMGAALDYADGGKKLVDVIRDKWTEEFIRGHDFEVLEGTNLREFKDLAGDTLPRWVSSTARLMVLFEPGFDLVLQKTEKAEGKRLRRILADEVLPRLRRGEMLLPAPASAPALGEWSPEAIALKKAALLRQIAEDMSPAVSAEAKDAMRANAAVLLTGGSIAPLLPALPPGRWHRPSEMAKELGRTEQAVGRAITQLGYRDQPEHRRGVLDKKRNGEGQVECSLWDDHVFEALRHHFEAAQ